MTPHAGLELLSTAVLMLDESFHVTYANPAAETLLAHGRKHLIGVGLDKALPGNEGFLQRLKQSLDGDAGFNENDLELDVGGERVHLHCVISPVEAGDSRLLLEFRELEQQLKIAREAKILEQQEAVGAVLGVDCRRAETEIDQMTADAHEGPDVLLRRRGVHDDGRAALAHQPEIFAERGVARQQPLAGITPAGAADEIGAQPVAFRGRQSGLLPPDRRACRRLPWPASP